MNEKLRIYLHSFVLYGTTAALSLAAAWRHVIEPTIQSTVSPLELTLENGLIFFGVFVVFTVLMVRFVRVAHLSLSFFLLVALVAGSQFIFSSWLGTTLSLVLALALAGLAWYMPRVIVHDVAIMLGIAGIAGVLGLSMTPLVACVLLAALSLYDIVSVYRTRHMVTLAGRMLESGAVFGFLVPARASTFFAHRDDALRTRAVMMLGSGDIGLPLVLATSAVSQSLWAAVLVVVGALIGVTAMHWLFSHQRHQEAMAALPPIAVASILGYAVAIAAGI